MNIWADNLGNYIIEPYFFDGMMNDKEYRKFLQNDLVNLLEEVPLESYINAYVEQKSSLVSALC